MAIITLSSCDSITQCESESQRQATLLIDVSDPKLFAEIENDLNINFPLFWQKSKIGDISPCQCFTLSMVELSSKDQLNISSEEICIKSKGQSRKKERKDADPSPLVRLMEQKVDDYKEIVSNPKTKIGSNISNVLLKAINQSNIDAENYFFVFSDMVENNPQANFYKRIPDVKEVRQFITKMIEPSVLEEFFNKRKSGMHLKVIVVMKDEPSEKVNKRHVKAFWLEFFNTLKIDVQFIDNLSNNIEL